MANTRFKLGDKVRYTIVEEYPGGNSDKKRVYSRERKLFTISGFSDSIYHVKADGSGEWCADDSCLVPANKPTIIIKRK